MPWWSILLLVALVLYVIGMIVLFFIKKKNGTLDACSGCPTKGKCHGQCENGKSELLEYYKNTKKLDEKENHNFN